MHLEKAILLHCQSFLLPYRKKQVAKQLIMDRVARTFGVMMLDKGLFQVFSFCYAVTSRAPCISLKPCDTACAYMQQMLT